MGAFLVGTFLAQAPDLTTTEQRFLLWVLSIAGVAIIALAGVLLKIVLKDHNALEGQVKNNSEQFSEGVRGMNLQFSSMLTRIDALERAIDDPNHGLWSFHRDVFRRLEALDKSVTEQLKELDAKTETRHEFLRTRIHDWGNKIQEQFNRIALRERVQDHEMRGGRPLSDV